MGGRLEGKGVDTPRLGDTARTGAPTCGPSDEIDAIRERVHAAGWDECVVVNEQNVVLGRLRPKTLKEAGGRQTAEMVMETGSTSRRPNQKLEEVTQRMQEENVDSMLVTNSDGQLIGILYRQDAEKRLAKGQEQQR